MLPHKFLKEAGGLIGEEKQIDRTLYALGYTSTEDSQAAVVVTDRPAPAFDFVAAHMPDRFGMQAYVLEAGLGDADDITQTRISPNEEDPSGIITVENSGEVSVALEGGATYLVPLATGHIALGELQTENPAHQV